MDHMIEPADIAKSQGGFIETKVVIQQDISTQAQFAATADTCYYFYKFSILECN